MREIKFRGMTITGEWVYGLLCKPIVGKYSGKTFISNKGGVPMAFEVRPETVGQYTGRNDKNEKEIYGGDILDISDKRKRRNLVLIRWEDGEVGDDYWNDHHYSGFTFPVNYNKELFEIIGNVCENPELINI